MRKSIRKSLIALLTLWPVFAFADEASIARGEYLTTILGCGGCHTEGALLGHPEGGANWLAGSRVGIAYTDYDPDVTPGIVFPSNLTPDKKTGLGRWSRKEIIRLLRTGLDHEGVQTLPVMPWPNYTLLNDDDVVDIADYLLSLPPVERAIPANVKAGEVSTEKYVRIGIFIYDPSGEIAQEYDRR